MGDNICLVSYSAFNSLNLSIKWSFKDISSANQLILVVYIVLVSLISL